MPTIKLEHIVKRWKNFYGTDDVSMNIEDNAFITLLGPSGCGKTTILRMIAGLETPTSGRITIGDRVVFDSEAGINVPANKRKVGFLFQNYALWPNMTVYQNISFGLTNVKEPMPKIDFDARINAKLGEILAKPNDVKKVINDCRDKNGKVDEKRALIKLIDTFIISMDTAKKLYGYGIQDGKDVSAEAKALAEKAENAKKSEGLNDNFEYVQNGQVVMEKRKFTKEEIDLTVRRVSRIVKIGMFMDRYPAELSGGQQQRVAIARTLAPEPTVLFMDEPLSNLDAKLRLEMRYELQRLHVETGSTFVYVTHDQMEAMTLATKICLLNNGVLQQYDAPLTVYNTPVNTFVADFVGNPSINFVNGTGEQKTDGSIALTLFGSTKATFRSSESVNLNDWFVKRDLDAKNALEAEKEKASKKGYVEKTNKDETFQYPISMVVEDELADFDPAKATNKDFVVGIRPEFVNVTDDNGIEGEVYGVMPTGMETTIKVRVGDYLLTGVVFGSDIFQIGSKVKVSFDKSKIMLFDRRSGKRIASGSLEL